MNSEWSYSPEKYNLGQNRWFFSHTSYVLWQRNRFRLNTIDQNRPFSPGKMRFCILDSNMSWLMVSNAAHTSYKSKITDCFSSTALRISSWIQVRALSALWYFLPEDWRHSCRPLVAICSKRRVVITFSIIWKDMSHLRPGWKFRDKGRLSWSMGSKLPPSDSCINIKITCLNIF